MEQSGLSKNSGGTSRNSKARPQSAIDGMSYASRKEAMSQHLSKLYNNNEDYFKLVRGGLVCGTCIKPRDLIMDYKRGQESTYTREYRPQTSSRAVPKVTPDLYGGYNAQLPMELSTTDYVPKELLQMKNEKKHDVRQFLPFSGITSYKNEFTDWGVNPTAVIKPGVHPTTLKDLPFNNKSMYTEQYQGKPADKDEERQKIINANRRGQFKSPINSDFPFLARTTSGSAFLPGKSTTISMKPHKKVEKSLPTFQGQYQTTHMRDYTEKKCSCNEKNCIICGKNMLIK